MENLTLYEQPFVKPCQTAHEALLTPLLAKRVMLDFWEWI
jgi:hypothetical protein